LPAACWGFSCCAGHSGSYRCERRLESLWRRWAMKQQSQFSLLGKRRFLPFFVTQLLGAFNDNVFKQALVLAILYELGTSADASLLVNLCALLFILPFF